MKDVEEVTRHQYVKDDTRKQMKKRTDFKLDLKNFLAINHIPKAYRSTQLISILLEYISVTVLRQKEKNSTSKKWNLLNCYKCWIRPLPCHSQKGILDSSFQYFSIYSSAIYTFPKSYKQIHPAGSSQLGQHSLTFRLDQNIVGSINVHSFLTSAVTKT